jgi:hypothetical protein
MVMMWCLRCRIKMQAILEEQAGLELGAVDTNNILTLLECPVCLDHITPPIKQCIKVSQRRNVRNELMNRTEQPNFFEGEGG